jgi:hypothetical protein
MASDKQIGLAYLLIIVGPFFGMFGLQRFYLGHIGMGMLYLFTFGLLGLGQLVDLLTFRRVVEHHNLKARSHDVTMGQFNQPCMAERSQRTLSRQLMNLKKLKQEERERVLLQFIKSKCGMITPIEIASESSLSMDQAKKELDNFCLQGAAEMRITEGGEIVFIFGGFLNEEQKRSAKSVLSV